MVLPDGYTQVESQSVIEQDILAQAVDTLRRGGVVAFPTETYYGLAVDPFNPLALARLFEVKKRSASKPILTLVDEAGKLSSLVGVLPAVSNILMAEFWPGPLTLVMEGRDGLSPLLTGNTGTVGVRISSHPLALKLVEAFGQPVTATSANISGCKPATTALQVEQQLGKGIDLVVDGGQTPGGLGSTVIDIRNNRVEFIRAGVVPYERIIEVVGGLFN